MRFAAIDLGASYIKSALVDTAGGSISHAGRVEFPPFSSSLPLSHREVPAEVLFQSAKGQIDRLLAHAPDCAGVLSCGQMHGLVLADRRGAPLTPFISWMDERAQPLLGAMAEKVRDAGGEELLRGFTAGSTAAILAWLKQEEKLPDGAVPYSLSDFVVARLSASETGCEPTMASGFGVFDVRNGGWHLGVIEALGLADLAWPKIAKTHEAVGSYHWQGKEVPLYAALGDQQCALFGSLLKPGELSVNVSTGSQVSTVKERFEPGDYEVRAYPDGLFLNTVTHLPAGRDLNKLAESTGTPWSQSEESPVFRSAFEKMAENYHAAARRLDPGLRWERLVFSGGLISKSPLLRRLVTERFGLPVRSSPTQEDTLNGLMVSATMARAALSHG